MINIVIKKKLKEKDFFIIYYYIILYYNHERNMTMPIDTVPQNIAMSNK